jgi:hypothetical protein
MASLQTDRPSWLQQVRDLAVTWIKWFGFWAFMDLVLHLADQRLGWGILGEPRTAGQMLFFDSWMAFWFILFSSGRGKLGNIIGPIFSRPKNSAL